MWEVFETFCPHGPLNVSGVGFGDVAMYDSRLYHWSYAHEGEEVRKPSGESRRRLSLH